MIGACTARNAAISFFMRATPSWNAGSSSFGIGFLGFGIQEIHHGYESEIDREMRCFSSRDAAFTQRSILETDDFPPRSEDIAPLEYHLRFLLFGRFGLGFGGLELSDLY
jgi:hypothetical protein